jgi:hypothetical protein
MLTTVAFIAGLMLGALLIIFQDKVMQLTIILLAKVKG